MKTFLTDAAEIARVSCSSHLSQKQRGQFGQFLTPAPVARWMAGQFSSLSGCLHLLDPGAGTGALTAAVVERVLANPESVTRCRLVAYELEPAFLPALRYILEKGCTALIRRGIEADYCLREENFIAACSTENQPLLQPGSPAFTHAILNPPYKKINSQSTDKKILNKLGIDTVNLYSTFVWLAARQLAEEGEMVAITPRSFCNGRYFRPFRKAFLETMRLEKLHVFASRSATFSDDGVLQENIVFRALKSPRQPATVQITNNAENALDTISEARQVPYDEVVEPDDPEQFIYIPTNPLETALRVQMQAMPCSLADLGLEVSTGPVVDFRLQAALRTSWGDRAVPLLYPEAIRAGKVQFPPDNPRKPVAIEHNSETQKWLIPSGWYAILKRFSAKEEKRRVVAAACPPLAAEWLGLENHLNYYHARGQGLPADLARGLAALLNSTWFDLYFRQFSGHTQVNATDLRRVKYPRREDLLQLGRAVGDRDLNQTEIDRLVHDILAIMPEAQRAVQASQKIQEALAILKDISTPREQQNERSALCLLALADLPPERPWSQAAAPRRGIAEMMAWFREHYGKQYVSAIHKKIQQQTLTQLMQTGLVARHSEQIMNSRQDDYQLSLKTLSLLQVYGSEQWTAACSTYRSVRT